MVIIIAIIFPRVGQYAAAILKARHGVTAGHIIDGETFIAVGGITKIINAIAFMHVGGFKKIRRIDGNSRTFYTFIIAIHFNNPRIAGATTAEIHIGAAVVIHKYTWVE